MFFIFLLSCINSNMRYIKKARTDFQYATSCADTLKAKFREAECNKVIAEEYPPNNPSEVVVRCYKDADKRGKFWDNWVFRISHANLQVAPESYTQISKHTICIDQNIRIEAYPADMYQFSKPTFDLQVKD